MQKKKDEKLKVVQSGMTLEEMKALCEALNSKEVFKHTIITPERAEVFLQKNKLNRKVQHTRIDAYVRDIVNGKWDFTNVEPIAFDEDGNLINGQHRCMAVVRAGRPIICAVVKNCKKEAIFDRGILRSTANILQMRGMSGQLSDKDSVALAKFIILKEKGISAPSDSEVESVLLNRADSILKTLEIAGNNHNKSNFRNVSTRQTPVRAAVYYAIDCGEDSERIKDFLEIVRSGKGAGSDRTNAAEYLRNYILDHSVRGRVSRDVLFSVSQQAIRDYLTGKIRNRQYQESSKSNPYLSSYLKNSKEASA